MLSDGESTTFTDSGSQSIFVTETIEPGWATESVTCQGAQVFPNSFASSFTVTFERGSDVTCTVVNEQIVQPMVTVMPMILGDGPVDETFTFVNLFTANSSPPLLSGETHMFTVDPGFFDVTVGVPSGWFLDSFTCTDLNGTERAFDATAEFSLLEGEKWDCLAKLEFVADATLTLTKTCLVEIVTPLRHP